MKAKKNKINLFESITKIMDTNIPTVKKGQTINEVISILEKKGKPFETIDYIYVNDKNENLVGFFSVKELFRSSKNTSVDKIMQTKIVMVSPITDAENVAHLALKHGLKAVPVVEKGKLLGVVSPREIIQILNKSLRKDLFHFAGIHKSHLEYENSLTVPVSKSLIHRAPWLIIGLIGVIIVAAYIGLFEEELKKYLLLAFFIPAIVYISDALGTQLQTILIRDMAILGKDLQVKKYFLKQMLISVLISFIVGIGLFLAVSIFWKQTYMAFVISLAAFVSLIFTSFTALLTTFMIKKLGYDPALGGGPLATIISDAASIVIYFATATLLL